MLKLSQPNISEEGISAVADVLRSGQLVHGQECDLFEEELAQYLGCSDVVLVSSGTAALHVALLALNIGPGDAVIVPDFTFPATANAVVMTGARPVSVDVDKETYTMSPQAFEALVSDWKGPEALRAVIPVHEFGCPAEMCEITRVANKYNLFVVEDAACALGANYNERKLGTLGEMGCFSFHPRKTLTTGEGGAIATNNLELARRARRLRSHGMERCKSRVQFIEPATNYRMTNFQAALGRSQLPHLDNWIKARRRLAEAYASHLSPMQEAGLIDLPRIVNGHSWQSYMVVLDNSFSQEEIIAFLKLSEIEANLGAQSLSSINIYNCVFNETFQSERLYRSGLALPMFETLDLGDLRYVCNSLSKALCG